MFRSKFQPQRPQAIAEQADRVRRLHQLRRMLAEVELPFAAFTSEPGVDERDSLLRSALH